MPFDHKEAQRLRVGVKAFAVTEQDLKTVVLVRLGQIHRRQEEIRFASEGLDGPDGKWPKLSEQYAYYKRTEYPGRKILVRTGSMKKKFINAKNPDYVQRYIKPVMQFGARSVVAAFHFTGTRRMPKRDPVSKSEAQAAQLRFGIVEWYRTERIPQALRGIHGTRGANK